MRSRCFNNSGGVRREVIGILRVGRVSESFGGSGSVLIFRALRAGVTPGLRRGVPNREGRVRVSSSKASATSSSSLERSLRTCTILL